MLWRVRELIGCAIAASDGDLGRIQDVYFDDQRWMVRYLVGELGRAGMAGRGGHGPDGRSILLAPVSVRRIVWTRRRVDVTLTREQLRRSPDADTQSPVDRQHRIALHEYYGLPHAWSGRHPDVPPSAVAAAGDAHLRSARGVIGYTLHAVDGDVGQLEDFLVDDRPWWAIPYVVVDTGHWWSRKRVLLSPEWIGWLSWIELAAHADLPRRAILDAPSYDPSKRVDATYEARLQGHFGRPPYGSPSGRAA